MDASTAVKGGNYAVAALLNSEVLDRNAADALVGKALKYNTTYWDSGTTSSQRELAGAVASYYWDDLKRQF